MGETTQASTSDRSQEARKLLSTFLNKNMKIKLTDGRVLIGIFLCTDKDANVILGSCTEYLSEESADKFYAGEPRMLGLAMVRGCHIVSIHVDDSTASSGTPAPRSSPTFT